MCPWRNQACPAQFASVALVPRSEFIRTTVRRAHALRDRFAAAPALAALASFPDSFLDLRPPAWPRTGHVVEACEKLARGGIGAASPDDAPRKRRRVEGAAASACGETSAPAGEEASAPSVAAASAAAGECSPVPTSVRAVVEAAGPPGPSTAGSAVWCALVGGLGWELGDAGTTSATTLALHCGCCSARALLRAGSGEQSRPLDPVRAHRSWCPYLGVVAEEGPSRGAHVHRSPRHLLPAVRTPHPAPRLRVDLGAACARSDCVQVQAPLGGGFGSGRGDGTRA